MTSMTTCPILMTDMNEQDIKQILERAIEDRFCCTGTECEAGYCLPRLIRIEEMLEYTMNGTAEGLNWIVDHLKKESVMTDKTNR